MFVCRHVTAWHVLLSWQVLFWTDIASPGGRFCEGDMVIFAGTVVMCSVQHCSEGQQAFMQIFFCSSFCVYMRLFKVQHHSFMIFPGHAPTS